MRGRESTSRQCIELMLAAAIIAGQLAGCSQTPPLGQVEGKVTFRGQPVTEGTISFSSDKGDGAETKLGPEGGYVLETPRGGLTLGEYVVTVTPEMYLDNSDPRTPPVMEEKAAPNIPGLYRRTGGTPLRWTIKEGKNVADFDLKP